MLAGDNSILQKATDAKTYTERASVIEQAQTDILGQIAENKGENISKDQLKTILSKYFENIDALEIPDDLSNSDIKLNANQQNGGYQNILLYDIYNGTFNTMSNLDEFNFTVDGTQYTAITNQTWKQWIGSTYNTNGFTTSVPLGSYAPVVVSGGYFLYQGNPAMYVKETDSIEKGEYIVEPGMLFPTIDPGGGNSDNIH